MYPFIHTKQRCFELGFWLDCCLQIVLNWQKSSKIAFFVDFFFTANSYLIFSTNSCFLYQKCPNIHSVNIKPLATHKLVKITLSWLLVRLSKALSQTKRLLISFQECPGKCYSIIIIVNKNDRNIKCDSCQRKLVKRYLKLKIWKSWLEAREMLSNMSSILTLKEDFLLK